MRVDNSKYLDAIRVSGGDPIGGGAFTGDVYFLINEWQLYVDHSVTVNGVLYSDDFPSPFVQPEGTSIVTNVVSSLVNTVSTSGNSFALQDVVDGVWNAIVANYANGGSSGALLQAINATAQSTKVDTTAIVATTNATQIAVGGLDTKITTAIDLVNTLLKYQRNRTKVDQNAYTLTVYDDNGITPLRVFDLRNFAGMPSLTEVAERIPV